MVDWVQQTQSEGWLIGSKRMVDWVQARNLSESVKAGRQTPQVNPNCI